MPRKKVTTITEVVPDPPTEIPEGTVLPIDETSLELTERLEQIRTQLGGGSDGILIKVYRIVPGKNPSFCFSDKSVDEEKIQHRCKSGTFQCNVIAGGKVIDTIEVDIDESSVLLSTESKIVQDPVLTLLMQQNAQLMQAFTQMIANGGNQSQQPTMMQVIEAVKSVKDLAGGSSDQVAMKMFEKGIDLATKVGGFGEKSWTSELFDTIKDVAKPLVPSVLQHLANTNGNHPPQQQLNQPVQTMTPEQQATTHLQQAIAVIKQQALSNVPVGLVLDWIVNHANEYANLIRVVISSDFADIAKLDPDITREPLSTYFKTLYDGLRQSYQESSTLDVDTDGESGDSGDNSENSSDSASIIVEPEVIHGSGAPRKRRGN